MFHTLIAEDNATFRDFLSQMLMRRFPFMRVVEAKDGREARQHGLSRRYDLIFMDIHLPDGNGLDLTHEIKKVFVDTVVCILTSYDLPEYRDVAIRRGADIFLVKGESTETEIVTLVECRFEEVIRATSL